MRCMNTLRACALLAAIAAVAATNLNAATVGDAVGWANAAPMDQKIDQARDAKWYLKLPAQGDVLPAGATVKIFRGQTPLAVIVFATPLQFPAKYETIRALSGIDFRRDGRI